MSTSETITRTDLANILNEILPLNFTTIYRNTSSNTIATAGIDATPTIGASVLLPKGYAYLIIGQWTFNSGSSSTTRNNQVIIKDITNNTNKAYNRVLYANQSYGVLQVSYITDVLTSNIEYAVAASSSMTYTSASTNVVTAIPLFTTKSFSDKGISTNTFQYVTNIDTQTTPSSSIYDSIIEAVDINDINYAYIGTNHLSSGRVEANLSAHRVVDNSDIYHGLGPWIDEDGTLGYRINDNTAFADALNFHIEEATSASTSLNAGSTTWVSVNKPSGSNPIAVVGYYINGGTTCGLYNMTIDGNGAASFAVRNNGSSKQTFTIKTQFLCVGG